MWLMGSISGSGWGSDDICRKICYRGGVDKISLALIIPMFSSLYKQGLDTTAGGCRGEFDSTPDLVAYSLYHA